jgi:hypothetical protein
MRGSAPGSVGLAMRGSATGGAAMVGSASAQARPQI